MKRNCQGIQLTSDAEELNLHGSVEFPIAYYEEDWSKEIVPLHWHEDLEYILIVKGHAEMMVDKKRIFLEEGEGIFINGGTLHAVELSEKTNALIRSVVFHPRLIGALDSIYYQKAIQPFYKNNRVPYCIVSLHEPWQRECNHCVNEAWEALESEEAFHEITVRSSLTKALCLLASNQSFPTTTGSTQQETQANRMKTMLEYIEQHLEEEVSLDDLVKITYSSKSSVLRTFEEYLGTSPMQYIKSLRMKQAAQLLKNTNEKCNTIAEACGFHDVSYFNRTFKSAYGCSPIAYRKANQ